VIRIPFDFQDGAGPTPKIFLVLGHRADAAISIKTTKNGNPFLTDPDRLAGVVRIPLGECPAFPLETFIDPANCFALPHEKLRDYDQRGELEILGSADGFLYQLRTAVENNGTINRTRRKSLLDLLD
jgi:hypothetical protein